MSIMKTVITEINDQGLILTDRSNNQQYNLPKKKDLNQMKNLDLDQSNMDTKF